MVSGGEVKAWKKGAVFGLIWGFTSGVLYFLWPEAFNLESNTRTLIGIPDSVKILMTLPIQLAMNFAKSGNGNGVADIGIFTIIAGFYFTQISNVIGLIIGGILGIFYDQIDESIRRDAKEKLVRHRKSIIVLLILLYLILVMVSKYNAYYEDQQRLPDREYCGEGETLIYNGITYISRWEDDGDVNSNYYPQHRPDQCGEIDVDMKRKFLLCNDGKLYSECRSRSSKINDFRIWSPES